MSAVLLAYVTWGAYRVNVRAWWCLCALIVLWTVSAVIAFSVVDMMEYYEKMNMPAESLELMANNNMMEAAVLNMSISSICILGYLLYIKKYFNVASVEADVSAS